MNNSSGTMQPVVSERYARISPHHADPMLNKPFQYPLLVELYINFNSGLLSFLLSIKPLGNHKWARFIFLNRKCALVDVESLATF